MIDLAKLAPKDLSGLQKRLRTNSRELVTHMPQPDPMLEPDEITAFYALAGSMIEKNHLYKNLLLPLHGVIIYINWLQMQAKIIKNNPGGLFRGHIKQLNEMRKSALLVCIDFELTPEDFENTPLKHPKNIIFL